MDLSTSDRANRLHAAWPALTPLPSSTNATYKHRSQSDQNQQHRFIGRQKLPPSQREEAGHNEYPDYVTAFTTKVKSTAQSLHLASGNGKFERGVSTSNLNPSSQRQHRGIPSTLPASSLGRLQHKDITRWNAASSDYTPIPISLAPEYMERMESLMYHPKDLENHGYVFDALSKEELARKSQRCKRCLKSLAGKRQNGQDKKVIEKPQLTSISMAGLADELSMLKVRETVSQNNMPDTPLSSKLPEPKPPLCKFHPGVLLKGVSNL